MLTEELKSRALRLLAAREHTRVELRRKLTSLAGAGAEADVEIVLDRMIEAGLQSDQRFAESYIRSRGPRLGVARLKHELAQRGIEDDVAQAALAEILGGVFAGSQNEWSGDELGRARAVWAKKFGTPPTNPTEWAKHARFMQSRGFAVDVIRKLLKEPFDESA
ncbi:MAG TPA: recombination regulator RecX [Rhodocyclaceae bacterium]|nr:recombination regulator RecX [Rhodocyclaceae bacterium]